MMCRFFVSAHSKQVHEKADMNQTKPEREWHMRRRKMQCGMEKRLNELALMLEKLNLADYLVHLHNTKRILRNNFFGGLARGLGLAVGFTLLGALVLYLLQQSFLNNLPLIGDFIADIVEIANERLKLR